MKKIFILTNAFLSFFIASVAQSSEIFTKNNKAVDGYDVVAFYKEKQPVKGVEHITYNWKNVTWIFSNQQNLDTFKSNPEKYAPQFGGYCAYGCSNGYKAPTQVDTWIILDDKLYFNYNQKVKESWFKNKDALIEKATKNWAKIKDNP